MQGGSLDTPRTSNPMVAAALGVSSVATRSVGCETAGSHEPAPSIPETLADELGFASCVECQTGVCLSPPTLECGHLASNSRPACAFIHDSGATRHMLPIREGFVELNERVRGEVALGNKSYTVKIEGEGTTRLSCLGRVLLVPLMSVGLISGPQLDREGFVTTLGDGRCTVRRKDNGAVVLTGKLRGNLYYIDREYREQILCSGEADAEGEMAFASVEFEQLHRDTGHASKTKMLRAIKKRMWRGIPLQYDDVKDEELAFCPACLEGRMKAFPRAGRSKRNVQVGDKFGIDYKGKFMIKSMDGFNGFYLIGDYASDYLMVKMVSSKAEGVAILALNEYLYRLELAKKIPRVMQCDYDTVLRSKKIAGWLRSESLKLQMSAPYVHSQNGFIEANMGKVMDTARTLMAEGRVPPRFWSFAIECSVYLSNRLPVAKLLNVTPLEAMTGEKPDVSTWVPFWSIGMYHLKVAERKVGPWIRKARRCRMIGYDEAVKCGFKIYDIESKSVLTRTDVVWNKRAIIEEVDSDDAEGKVADCDIAALEKDIRETAELERLEQQQRGDVIIEEAGWEDSDDEEENPYFAATGRSELLDWLADCREHAMALEVLDLGGDAGSGDPTEETVASPATLKEALAGPEAAMWDAALGVERENFRVRGVFVAAPQTGHAMGCKIIVKKSKKPDGSFKYKVRLVAKGFTQIKHVNYNETYAPTTSTTVVLLLLQYAVMQGLHLSSFDVTAAFLEGENDYPNFAWIPLEFGGEFAGKRVEVKGNFYGEKQAPKVWNDKLNEILVAGGCERSAAHPCLYKYARGKDFIICCVHVDDGLVATNNPDLRRWLEALLKEALRQVTFEAVVKKYIGIDVNYDQAGKVVSLTHGSYITDNWSTFTNGAGIPMCPSHNLRTAEKVERELTMLQDTGKFRFACDRARPDILVATGEIATGGDKNPSLLHERVSFQVKNYLNATRDLGLVLRGGDDSELDVFGYCDAAYITQGNCKSRLGGCIFLNSVSGAIRSFSKTDTQVSSISHSSTEAEIKAIDEWVREVMHIMDLLEFLCGKPYGKPIPLFVDNKSAIELCTTLKQNHKVKHINLRINFIREMVMRGFVTLHFIGTADNTADVLTKALGGEVFTKHRDVLLSGHGGAVRRRLEERTQLAETADNIDA